MENMPTQNSRVAKIDDIPAHLYEIIKDIRQGREVVLTEHEKIIARIIPVSNSGKPEKWPAFSERAIAIFGKSPKTSASESLTKTREERF
ncbi:Uncharacterized protein dnl_33590 [Desulfonema limicola]|uniref:Antitoxin n=1 Tax=Desulfonema limicola TaxID=45656 RepID=A0A975B9H1_9BACT|nr:hypothetical protein [Desulfonema limicola]QTA81035.1 Uncharacterized protein dnl_33590 [Desulfonema limicola]